MKSPKKVRSIRENYGFYSLLVTVSRDKSLVAVAGTVRVTVSVIVSTGVSDIVAVSVIGRRRVSLSLSLSLSSVVVCRRVS